MAMITDFFNWILGAPTSANSPKVEKFDRVPYVKREYMTGPSEQTARGWETQWELPAVNPVLEVMSHGMEAGAPTNVVKRTAVSIDPRGEPDFIKSLASVDIPNFLMSDRVFSGAIERSELRNLTPETEKYGM
jgi:hypothetical protein